MSWTPLYYIAHILSDGRAVISIVWSMNMEETISVWNQLKTLQLERIQCAQILCRSLLSCALCLCCNLALKELSSVQRVNSKELPFTWLSRCCYGREARQRRKKPLSLTFPFSLSRSLSLLLCSRSLSSREPGWLQNHTANESTQLSLLCPFIFQITAARSFLTALWNIISLSSVPHSVSLNAS